MSNRYLFHWLTPERLDAFSQAGRLRPAWRHFILDEGRLVTGTSFCEEPMLWVPDEDQDPEPCLIVDIAEIDCPVHWISSGDEYHLTKKVARARRLGRDVSEVVDSERLSRRLHGSRPDEAFVEGAVGLGCVVGVGYERGFDGKNAAEDFAARHGLPVLDMNGWKVGSPGIRETDCIIDELRSGPIIPR